MHWKSSFPVKRSAATLPLSRINFLASLLLTGCMLLLPICEAQDKPELSAEEQREQLTAQRFLDVLIRRPNKGTALDRVFSYHIARGDITDVIQELSDQAASTTDDDEAGRHWVVVGLLQLQRGEDAKAVQALSTAEQKLPENSLAAYYHGQALLLIGRTDEAAEAMQRAIDLKPTRQEYLRIAAELGQLYQRSGKPDQALKIWEQLEKTFPGDDGVRERIARIMLEEGDVEGALTRYQTLAKEARRDNDKIVYALKAADLRARLGEKDPALKDLETLLGRLRPGSYLYGEARRRIESAFLNSGDYAGLASYYEKWIEANPEDIGAVVRLARTLSIQGRGPEAIEWFQKAIERAPSEAQPRIALINAYVAQENFADAAKQYETLVELDPNNPDHLVRWGQVMLEDKDRAKTKRLTDAASVWQRLADSRKDDAVVQSQVADLFRGAELTDKALQQYRLAIELAPKEPQYKEYLGEYLHQLDRKNEALEVWKSLAAGELRTRDNLVRLAEVLNQFDQPEQALTVMGEACELDPTIEHRLRYTEWLRDAERYDDALQQVVLAAEAVEDFDEGERVFTEEVKTYQASGQLADRIEQSKTQVAGTPDDSEAWRRLSVLHNAAGESAEALDCLEKALEIAPDSIEALAIAARMYEDAGRLREAIGKRVQLAESDQRFRAGHLQKLADLHVNVGEPDKAIEVGKELLAASAGSVESYRFYANLCGSLGRFDERLDTLRRCVRLNPRSVDAQRMLATQLAEDFKTDQAIELYWKMLDSSDDIEGRRSIVETLTDLYLRTNRLDQLIARLEIRGRESGDRCSTVDLISTAHQQAGDLGLARQTLEGLLSENGRDTLLLSRLVTLSELTGDYDEAVRLQRQLTRLSPERKNEARLASLLIDIGAMEEAQAMWLRMAESTGDQEQLSRTLNRLFMLGEGETAIKLAKRALEKDSDNWETLTSLMVLQADSGDWEAASKSAEKLLAIDLDPTTLPAGGKPYQATRVFNGQSYPMPPLRILRIQSMYEFYRVVDQRYGSQTSKLPTPMDLEHARLMGRYCQLKQMNSEAKFLTEHLAELQQRAEAEDATGEEVFDWYCVTTLAASVRQSGGISYQDPSKWKPIWRLVDVDEEIGSPILTEMLMNRSRSIARDDFELTKLPRGRLKWLKEQVESPGAVAPSYYGQQFPWIQFYSAELRIAGQEEEAEKHSKQHLEQLLAQSPEDLKSLELVAMLQQVSELGTDDQLWSVINVAIDKSSQLASIYGRSPVAGFVGQFASQKRIDDKLSAGPDDPTYRERLFTLMDRCLQGLADKPVRNRTIRLTGVGGPRNSYVMVGSTYEQINIEFPPQGLGPADEIVQAQYSAWKTLKDHRSEWLKSLRDHANAEASPSLKIWRKIATASVLFWEDRLPEALVELQQASEIAATELPQMEPELRLLAADVLLRQDRKRDALAEIDSLAVYDQRTMAVREFAAARLAAAIGDQERAKSAARRLFGVRIGSDAQIELAKLMKQLGMTKLASDLVRRMRSQGGNNTTQLQTLMTYFVAQGENEQAAEVAMELLRRSAPARRQSSSSVTADQARRRNALQTLATTGRLTELIKTGETRLENAPKSQRIRSELAEMYTAAGRASDAAKLLGDANLKDVNSAQALEATAKQLVAAGKMDEACEAYLRLLKRNQDVFSRDFYDIKEPFDKQKRLGDLADLIMEVGTEKFTDHRVSELCENLLRRDEVKKARELYLKILDQPANGVNSSYALSNIMGNAREILTDQESVRKTAQYLLDMSEGQATWATLFNGYSTGGDGRHNNVTTYFVRHVTGKESTAKLVEDMLRDALEEREDWLQGKVWLGLHLTAMKRYEEALEFLEPLVSDELKPAPPRDAMWLVGSLVDTHEPMRDFSLRLYEQALEMPSTRSGSRFEFSMEGRICKFMADIGQQERARKLIFEAIEQQESKPARSTGNRPYDAYQKIQTTMGMIDFLTEIDYPVDALRMAREFDRSLFVKAERYSRNYEAQLNTKQDNLLKKVRKLGGLATLRSLVSPDTSQLNAVDFGITQGTRPFSSEGLSSLWLDLATQATENEVNAEEFEAFVAEMEELAESRPQDDTAKAASALAMSLTGNREPLRNTLKQWLTASEESQNPRLRNRLIMLGLLHLNTSDGEASVSDTDVDLVRSFTQESVDDLDRTDLTYFLAAVGRQQIERKQQESAKEFWQQAVALKANQWLLLDLSEKAVSEQMPQLSADAFAAAVQSPAETVAEQKPSSATGSLGQLLQSARPQSRSSFSNQTGIGELDATQVRLARQILQLDSAWRKHKLQTKLVFDSLMALTADRPLCVPVQMKNNRMVIDSVFDRLALRAKWTDRTDSLVEQLSDDTPLDHLLAGIAWLRAEQPNKALARYKKVDASLLRTLPKEAVLQSLLLGMKDPVCRSVAMKLGLSLVDQNRPTERYANIEPFGEFSLEIATTALNQPGAEQTVTRALTDYLELTAHDNDRYSSLSSQLSRRKTQLEKVAQMLLPKGRLKQALTYLGMRSAAFNEGMDRNNDWIGSWAMESINSLNPQEGYQLLADWTFQGDGALQSIQAFVRRQPLPDWIPPELAGYYPKFAPVADPDLPLASSYYFLVKLAQKTNQLDDLFGRLEEAHEKQRAGANVALAVALKATGRPIDPALMDQILKRVESVSSGEGPKSAAPLAELQLASLLAADPSHRDTAKSITQMMYKHTHDQRRGYLQPWVARYDHLQGWAKTSDWTPSDQLAHWTRSTITNSKDYSDGRTLPTWAFDGDSTIQHISGSGGDFLWFQYPLQGNFSIEVETTDGSWSEGELVFDGLRTMAQGYNKSSYFHSEGNDAVHFSAPSVKPKEWNLCRMTVDEKHTSYFINDQLVYQEPRRNSSPFAALHAEANKTCGMRNFRITGDVQIPRSVKLIPENDLRGWTARYFNLRLPTAGIQTQKHRPDQKVSRYRTGPEPSKLNDVAWTVRKGELISGEITNKGHQGQSSIRYERPLADSESIRYEFFYEEGKTEVHPSIGRSAYVFRPNGLHFHWMSAGGTSWKIPEGYEVPAPGVESQKLPLRTGEWNQVELKRSGSSVQILLNDQVVFDGEPQSRLGDMVFGLFHYANKTKARVRNVVLSGDWPDELPENLMKLR